MLAARRSLLASTAAAAASRRRSVWWSPVAPARRWLATVSAGDNDGADNAARLMDKKRETPGQKNAREFALLPKLLQTFEDATGHLIVPYHFVIPHADASIVMKAKRRPTRVFGRVGDVHQIPWSGDARGVNFGRVLHKFANNPKYSETHPQVTNALREIGLPLGEAYSKLAWDEQIMAALRTFYQIHKHAIVPIQFEVPRGDSQWPVATWGYNLGRRVDALRTNRHQLSDSELADLESVEFSFNVLETLWSDHVLPSLETYAQVHGNCRIPHAFEVPHEDPWPRKAWGLQLGSVVDSIRTEVSYGSRVQRDMARLEAIRFVWDDSEYQWSEKVLPSLEVFYQVYGHSRVPQSFDVPSELPWPIEAWGLKLGVSVSVVRSRGGFARQTERDATRLDAIGFVWGGMNEHKWTHVILPALEVFTQVFGHCDVPNAFVVPSESPWPETAWGWLLGDTVTGMRSGKRYQTQWKRDASRLESIGFVRNHREFKWNEQILPSLEAFFQVHGHTRVPTKFVVPSQTPWPEKAWGLKLGPTVRRVVSNQAYAEFTDRDADRLAVIGFRIERRAQREASGRGAGRDMADGDTST